MKRLSILLLMLAALAGRAQQPTPLQIELVQVATGVLAPIGIYNCGDDRLFVIEQVQGDIEVYDTTGTYIGTFLDVTSLISTGSERGLLGLAFHPDYLNNGYFYINYTNTAGSTVVARYSVSGNPNVADPNSAQIILTVPQPYSNHNGGHLAFGPDGYLYIGLGDGGSAGDPGDRAQNMALLLGKMLRIDVDSAFPYAIPPDNPFVGQAGIAPEIWASGLRNPWKYSFDRLTGDLWIGDVGQNAWEEVDMEPGGSPGGLNYGWRCYEGNAGYNLSNCQGGGDYTWPVADFPHSAPYSFCAVTGGIVYRGSKFPGMYGHYIFTDFCAADFYSLYPDGNGGFTETLLLTLDASGFPAFGEDAAGELYTLRTNGIIYRIEDACGSYFPTISSDGEGSLVADGGSTIWWWKDGELLNGITGASFSPEESGTYYATVEIESGCIRQSNAVEWLVNGGIPGCTYPEALNYDPDAEADDGSCVFGLAGCTYPEAINFNPEAIQDDGSCDFGTPGCTYPSALNYNPDAIRDDGTCDFGLTGCTYNVASNYNPSAVVDDGSCIFPGGTECPVDLNGDNIVNVEDLQVFIAAWGVACE